jgi:TRAP-type transport system small permease protein
MVDVPRMEGGGARALRLADTSLCWFSGALVAVLLAVVTAGIVTRSAGHPLAWTDEAAGYLMVWLASSGWMIATRRNAHICIRFFANLLPERGRGSLDVLLTASTAVFGAAMVATSFYQVRANADIEAMALPISQAWLYIPLVPAGALTFVQALVDLVAAARHAMTPAPREFP